MDDGRRKALDDRRRFMRQRIAAREFRAGLEPAWTALERSGEEFRVYGIKDMSNWLPAWVPEGYSYIPWDRLPGVQRSADQVDDGTLAELTCALLAERLGPDDAMLVVADVGDWTLGLTRGLFERHAVSILASCYAQCWIAAPPSQWLLALEGHSLVWKDA